ncbi:MAG: FHA domain-containing protein [Gammaproteobacteria bacterium]|nr:FHA domain-containing protein [Gammaproteobacteria bacterium]
MSNELPYLRRLSDDARFPLTDKAILGRHSECDIALVDEPGLSRKHARFHVTNHSVAISDLGSLNGTLVNGKAVFNRCELHSGDQLIFDEHEFAIVIPARQLVSAEAPTRVAAPSVAASGAYDLDGLDDIIGYEAADQSTSVVTPKSPQLEPKASPEFDPEEKFSTTGVWQNNRVHPDAPLIYPRRQAHWSRRVWLGIFTACVLGIFYLYLTMANKPSELSQGPESNTHAASE